MLWILLLILIGCGSQETPDPVSLVIQLPSAISQDAGRKARFMKRVRYLQIQLGEAEPVRFPPDQWNQLPLGDLPEATIKIAASIWDLDRAGKARSYAVMTGNTTVTRSETLGQAVLLKLTSRIATKDYD